MDEKRSFLILKLKASLQPTIRQKKVNIVKFDVLAHDVNEWSLLFGQSCQIPL
jgi:hypothetical protein